MNRKSKNIKSEIKINFSENCINCGKCIEVCPMGVITYKTNSKESKIPKVFDAKACISCGHCIAVCPKDAIIHNQLPIKDFPKIDSSYSIEWNDFVQFSRQSRSIRVFTDESVPKKIIDKILNESTRYAPTGHNRQITKILIYEGEYLGRIRNEINSTILRLLKLLNIFRFFSKSLKAHWRNIRSFKRMIDLGMDPSTRYAPVVMLFTAHKRIKESEVDAAILSYHALISAELLGLKSCYLGVLVNVLPYSRKLRKLIKLPSNHKVVCGLLLGYSNIKYNRLVKRNELIVFNKET